MIYFIDFDFTIADTSITEGCSGNFKEKQKLIPQFILYDKAVLIYRYLYFYIIAFVIGVIYLFVGYSF